MAIGGFALKATHNDLIGVYCARSWWVSTWRVTHTLPLTSPPLTTKTINLEKLARPIVYIRLHGIMGQPYLYGDPGWITALSVEQVRLFDFERSLVFLEGCYGAQFANAFLDAGARAVVGSSKVTWGKKFRIGQSSKVGRAWLDAIKDGLSVVDALSGSLRVVRSPFDKGWTLFGDQGAKINV